MLLALAGADDFIQMPFVTQLRRTPTGDELK